ncbi:AAA family ATPase [Clostridium sp. B9]|uniref:AAA family ATPase n=1 Tax=Clostridium sp. B9 TaxID=3423224 RepID=UPI003D2F4A42
MKPIKLEIKGLNSFIDKQTIDFEKLTERGLFGIFGPTGSGKSTILDGITLALYGDIARKSSNYINTNCDGVYVSYEFQIAGKEVKKYRVDREFKRDNKTGGIRNKSSKIIDITNGLDEVLEDKAKAVTAKCEEIIGLKLDDFMRTVVLPQGKFSEFLKLEGKERRNMLERLFNLRKYGDDLSVKLNSEIRKEKDKMNVLEGQLKGYEGVSEEALKEKSEEIDKLNGEIVKQEKEFKKLIKEFEAAEKLWHTQIELEAKKKEEEDLISREKEITSIKVKVDAGERAERIAVFIESFEEILETIKKSQFKLENLQKSLNQLEELKKESLEKFEIAKKTREEVLPSLNLKREKLIESEKEKNILLQIKNEGVQIKAKYKATLEEFNKNKIKFDELDAKEKQIAEGLKIREDRIDELFVEETFKEKINRGLFILNDYEKELNQKSELIKEEEELISYIKEATSKKEKASNILNEKVGLINRTSKALEELIKGCPGDQNKILEMQSKVSTYKEGLCKYTDLKINLNEALKKKNQYEKSLNVFGAKRELLDKEVVELKDYVKKLEIEELAHKLREDLGEGEACPVCGSIHHELENIDKLSLELSNEKRELLESKDEKLRELTLELSKIEYGLEYEDKNISEINKTIENLGEFKVEELNKLEKEFIRLKEEIDKYNESKSSLENSLEKLKEEKNELQQEFGKLEVSLCEKIISKEGVGAKRKVISKSIEEKSSKLEAIKEELNINDIKSENESIIKKDREKSALEKEVKSLRESVNRLLDEKEVLRKTVEELKDKYAEEKSLLESKVQVYKEKERMIRESLKGIISEDKSVENINFKLLLETIEKEIESIDKNYLSLEKQKDEVDKKFQEVHQELAVTTESLNDLVDRKIKAEGRVKISLEEENFTSIEEAKNSKIKRSEIVELKKTIEEYNNSLIKVRGNIELLSKKLDGKNLSKDQWNEILEKKEFGEKELKDIQEFRVKLMTELENIRVKLEEQKEILEIRAKQEHKLALLSDLEKLFKGKRFVEFIAANQLKYISIEASKKLKDITNGVYGLEVDENGKFIIRDYKNGGAERDASTLSGGETFLASLALALSLSSQIQLKGTAPLELFFLDEGFGTLDDNLLDVVMSSLERLHHERLSVGIISHVESIKNRVPVKLMLTSAEAGLGGSKVKIERS